MTDEQMADHNQATLDRIRQEFLPLHEIGFNPGINVFVGIDWVYGCSEGQPINEPWLYVFPSCQGGIVPDTYSVDVLVREPLEQEETSGHLWWKKTWIVTKNTKVSRAFTRIKAETLLEFKEKLNLFLSQEKIPITL